MDTPGPQDSDHTPLQRQAARELADAGVDGGREFALAEQYPLYRVREVIRRARREGMGGGWIVKALMNGWHGDTAEEPDWLPEAGQEEVREVRDDARAYREEVKAIEAELEAASPQALEAAARREWETLKAMAAEPKGAWIKAQPIYERHKRRFEPEDGDEAPRDALALAPEVAR